MKNTILPLITAFIFTACTWHNTQPLHFAQDLKAVKGAVDPGENIVLELRLPAKIEPLTDAVIYKASQPQGPFSQLTNKPEIIGEDRISFSIPTLKTEGGYRYFQVSSQTNPNTPYTRSDVERVLIQKPSYAQLQYIHFGHKTTDPMGAVYMCSGDKKQLEAYGKYTDGIIREITQGELGTRYKIANPPYYENNKMITRAVIDITEGGFLEAFTPGQATIIISNGVVSNSREIFVDDCHIQNH